MSAKLITISLFGLLVIASCSRDKFTQKVSGTPVSAELSLDSIREKQLAKENDKQHPEYYEKLAQIQLTKAYENTEFSGVDSAFLKLSLKDYKKATELKTANTETYIICGILSEKIEKSPAASNFYLQAIQQAKANLNQADQLAIESFSDALDNQAELEEIQPELVQTYKNDQQFLIMLCEAMLDPNSSKFSKLQSFATEHPELPSLQNKLKSMEFSSKNAVLSWIE